MPSLGRTPITVGKLREILDKLPDMWEIEVNAVTNLVVSPPGTVTIYGYIDSEGLTVFE